MLVIAYLWRAFLFLFSFSLSFRLPLSILNFYHSILLFVIIDAVDNNKLLQSESISMSVFVFEFVWLKYSPFQCLLHFVSLSLFSAFLHSIIVHLNDILSKHNWIECCTLHVRPVSFFFLLTLAHTFRPLTMKTCRKKITTPEFVLFSFSVSFEPKE